LEQYPDGSGDGPSTRWVKILPVNGSNIYFVGTSTGVYSTTTLNGDKTVWAQEGANTIGNSVVDAIDARSTDGLVVVATHGKGIFTTHVNATAPIDSSNILLSFDNNIIPARGVYSSKFNSIMANRLTAPSNTFKITKLMYYITADHSGGAGSFYPFEDACVNSNGELRPSTYGSLENIYTPSTIPGWNTVDLSSAPISISPSPNYVDKEFFAGVEYDGTHEPAIGYDSTSSNGRGWYNDGNIYNWTQLDSLNPPWHITLYIRAEISTVTGIVDISTEVPKNFELSQNYPNPFNPSTTIEYDLPKGENVKLKVCDILGREVASLVDAYQAAGTYKVQWNGRNNNDEALASGIYLYSFEAGSYKAVKKMLYLK
jgi:hypothetical protein